jgi:hypothetical protein
MLKVRVKYLSRNQMKKKILYTLIVFFLVYAIWIGYLSGNNSVIWISNTLEDQTTFDIEVKIDNEIIIKEIVSTENYGDFGKIHDIQINPGTHKIIVKSEELKITDSINFFAILNSKFYIEIQEDLNSNERFFMIDKRFGKTLVYE